MMMKYLRPFFTATLVCLITFSGLHLPAAAQTAEPVYDIVIRNGRVLDGAGNPWIAADVAITNGKFVRIGRIDGKGKREIDATGDTFRPDGSTCLTPRAEFLQKNGLA
jgi:hypothetical protein